MYSILSLARIFMLSNILPYYQTSDGIFTTYQADTMRLLGEMDTQFDMIFADPPYFLSKGFTIRKGDYVKCFDKGDWDRQRSPEEVDEFNMRWLSLCRQRLKDSGTIWASGTYHNIYSVANCMVQLGYKILNVIVWQKPNAPLTLSDMHFNFSAEYIIWARKNKSIPHFFNYDLMNQLNGGIRMSDVWSIPTVEMWEKHFGKHPTQKPLRLLYRIILASTRPGEFILDPFAGSCTTGIAANLLGRRFVGVDQDEHFLYMGRQRCEEMINPVIAQKMLERMSVSGEEPMVVVNHARTGLREKMIEQGICYLRAGNSKGSLLVKPGFERLQYVLLHTGGDNCQMFRLRTKGHFQIWTRETLENYGFHPEHASYYIVLHFDNKEAINIVQQSDLKQGVYTYQAKIRPISDFTVLNSL